MAGHVPDAKEECETKRLHRIAFPNLLGPLPLALLRSARPGMTAVECYALSLMRDEFDGVAAFDLPAKSVVVVTLH